VLVGVRVTEMRVLVTAVMVMMWPIVRVVGAIAGVIRVVKMG